MEKIIFLTNRLPFPSTDGRKNILMQYIKHVKELYPDSQVLNLSFIDNEDYIKEKPDYIDKVISLDKPKLVEKLINVTFYSIILRKWPIQVSIFFNRKTQKKVQQILAEEKPDFIFLDMLRVTPYAPKRLNLGTKLILNYDDLLSLRYIRQLSWIDYVPSVLGTFSSDLPKALLGILDLKYVKKQILKFESKLLSKYEKRSAFIYDHLLFTSPKEASDFRELTGVNSCLGIPMVFLPENLSSHRKYNHNKVVFVGSMDIPHNTSAVKYFCENIWHGLKNRKPDLEFYIVGKNPSKEVLELPSKYPDVIVTGKVENIKSVVIDSAVMVAPLLFGTGIKTKIIESMAWGVPVVTNEIGAEGINLKYGDELKISHSDSEFVENIIKLVDDSELNHTVSIQAKRFINKEFGPNTALEKIKMLFD